MLRALLPTLVLATLLASCGTGPSEIPANPATLSEPQTCLQGTRDDTVVAVDQNLSIGFRVEDLLFINLSSDSTVYRRARGIFSSEARSLPRERIRRVAQELAAIRPDVAGLQECLRLDSNGVVAMDMLDTLRKDLDALGMSGWKLLPRPMNHVDFTARSPAGDSLRIVFHEGLALLVSPRWSVAHEDLFPYASLLSIKILQRRASSERAAQGAVLVRDDGFRLEVWNTHLEVLSFQRLSQATELAILADSLRWIRRGEGPSGRILLGDLNSSPYQDADSLLRLSGWRDAWDDASARLSEPGSTCCVSDPRSPLAGYRATGRRIDRILHQGGCGVDTSSVRLDEWFLTPAGDTLWASDHGMLATRIRYGVRKNPGILLQARPATPPGLGPFSSGDRILPRQAATRDLAP